jgi:hypothetical protein
MRVVGRSIDWQRTASTSNAYLPTRTSMIYQFSLPDSRQSFRRITSCSISLSRALCFLALAQNEGDLRLLKFDLFMVLPRSHNDRKAGVA